MLSTLKWKLLTMKVRLSVFIATAIMGFVQICLKERTVILNILKILQCIPVPFISKEAKVVKCDANWAPFKSEKDFLACLLMGCLHNLVSRAAYLQKCVILAEGNFEVPHWDAVQGSRAQIRKLLNFDLKETISVWNNKCFQMWCFIPLTTNVEFFVFLVAARNCLLLMSTCNNNLEYYPHDPTSTKFHSLSQCFKWSEDLACEYRVQMVASRAKHFYIFEPTKLFSGDVV
ncbi:hypothetical protein MJO29_003546, partial [Puccinia striiformis f. sp. tritici]